MLAWLFPEPGFGEQVGVTAGPPPCGEEPPHRARAHVLKKALGAGLRLSKEGGAGSKIRGISAALGPSLCPAWGLPSSQAPHSEMGLCGGSPMHEVSTPCHPSQAAGAEGCGAVSPMGMGDTPHPPHYTLQSPHSLPRGHTELGLSPAHSTAHLTTTPRRQQHIQTARQRKHGQAWTSTAGECEATSVAPGQ